MAGSETATPASPNGSVNPSGSSLVKDGPVLSMMNKRLRALKKKYNRILQIEESKAQGKVINKEQDDVLKSKASVAVLIEEYERLRQPLAVAVKEEIAEREKELLEDNAASKEPTVEDGVVIEDSGTPESGTQEAHDRNELKTGEATPPPEGDDAKGGVGISDEAILELLKILYFAHLFDVASQNDFASMMWTKMHERSSCLSYDYVTDDATKPLAEEDLDALSLFGSLMTSRPPNATLSHKSALQSCVYHARQWLANSEQQIHPDNAVSYSDLSERLNRILSSEYFTMTPELQTVTQQTAAAAATAAGQFVTQVYVHEKSAEGHVFHPEAEAAMIHYAPQDHSGTEQKLYEAEEYSATSAGGGDQLNSVGEENSYAQYVAENGSSFEVSQSDISQSPKNPSPTLDHESHAEQLPSHSQVPHQKQQQAVPEGHQELDLEPEVHQRQSEYQRRDQQQYYSQNGGMSRGYQGQRGGRGMGYGGGRGRGYMNGRGGRTGRGGSYSGGRGQYYDQGNYYPRNNSGRGRGRKSDEMVYNQATGPSQKSAIAATN